MPDYVVEFDESITALDMLPERLRPIVAEKFDEAAAYLNAIDPNPRIPHDIVIWVTMTAEERDTVIDSIKKAVDFDLHMIDQSMLEDRDRRLAATYWSVLTAAASEQP